MTKFSVRVTPNSSRDEIIGFDEQGILRIRLKAKAIEGKANKALIALVADQLKIKKQSVQIISGTKNRLKIVEINSEEGLLKKYLINSNSVSRKDD